MFRPITNKIDKHIKYVFVFKQNIALRFVKNRENDVYFMSFLTDDNEVYFEKLFLHDEFKNKKISLYEYLAKKLRKVGKIFAKYNMDRYTKIVFSAVQKFKKTDDFLHNVFDVFSIFTQTNVRTKNFDCILTTIKRFHKFDNRCFHRIYETNHPWNQRSKYSKNVNICFDGIGKTRTCPWIGPEMDLFLMTQTMYDCQIYRYCLLGLWYMVIRDYLKSKSNYVLKGIKKNDMDMSDFKKFFEEISKNQ